VRFVPTPSVSSVGAPICEHYLRGLKLEPRLTPDRLAAELASAAQGLTGANIAFVCQREGQVIDRHYFGGHALSKENTRHAGGWPGRSITVTALPVNASMTHDQNGTAPGFPSKTRTIHLPGNLFHSSSAACRPTPARR
jgi:hypothetical protein